MMATLVAHERVALVQSSTHAELRYHVSLPSDGPPSCTCPAFYYGTGRDRDGACKYIRRALDRDVVWLSQVGESGTCACCGAPLGAADGDSAVAVPF